MKAATGLPHVLLVEPQFVLRRTIVEVARQLGVAQVVEAAKCETARPLLAAQVFDGVVIDLGLGAAALDLLSRLRAGAFVTATDVPVVAMVADAHKIADADLMPLAIFATLRRPFKVGELLQVIERMTRPAG